MRARSILREWPLAAIAAIVTVVWVSACGMINGLDEFERVEGQRGSSATGVGGFGTSMSSAGGAGGAGEGGSHQGGGGGSPGVLLFSEVRSRGLAGVDDEFVELYNPTGAAVTAGPEWVLGVRTAPGRALARTRRT